ncbi:uncharacterized protein LOC113946006 [Corapipo altera]|uniref:uncharacterized protein LOC113946006 n=1 Tax=Corapipo altera TaxID=415028 RepID=UPI000FD6A197|nr:uncharacterized protein LOC113946006 [Corapipo altera]
MDSVGMPAFSDLFGGGSPKVVLLEYHFYTVQVLDIHRASGDVPTTWNGMDDLMQQAVIKEQEDEQHYLVAQCTDEAQARSEGSIPGKTVDTQIHFTVLSEELSEAAVQAMHIQGKEHEAWASSQVPGRTEILRAKGQQTSVWPQPEPDSTESLVPSKAQAGSVGSPWGSGTCDIRGDKSPGAPSGSAAISLPPSPAEPLLSILLLQAMALSVTQILMVLGVLQFILLMDDQSVKVTEELLKQHEERLNQEMVWLMEMEKRLQEQTRLSEESLLLSACQRWWFWASAEILLVIFGFYWLPKQRSTGSESSSQWGNSNSAQEQREEEEDWEDKSDPYNTQDKPLDKGSAAWWVCQ